MLIRRHLPNGRSNHCEITKPLIFKGLTWKHRVCDQRLNYRPIYTINTDIQSVTRSALESDKWHSKWYSTQQCLTEKAESEIVPKTTPPISVCLYFTQYIFHLVRFGTLVPPRAMFYMQIWRKLPMSPSRKTFFKSVGK